jgi:hypothetical protein
MAAVTDKWATPTTCASTAPAMAMIAPTERSTPPVAMTSVMPRASSMTFEPWLITSTKLP